MFRKVASHIGCRRLRCQVLGVVIDMDTTNIPINKLPFPTSFHDPLMVNGCDLKIRKTRPYPLSRWRRSLATESTWHRCGSCWTCFGRLRVWFGRRHL